MFRMVMTIEDYEAHQADYEAYEADMAEMSKDAEELQEEKQRVINTLKAKVAAIDWALDTVKEIAGNVSIVMDWLGERNGLLTAIALLQGEQV